MDVAALRAVQAPPKERYRDDPDAALITLRADGDVDGGAVATSLGIDVRAGRVSAEGDLDFAAPSASTGTRRSASSASGSCSTSTPTPTPTDWPRSSA